MHCSTIAYFMQPGNERTPRQLWEDACEGLANAQKKYDDLTNKLKGMKTGANWQVKIAEWKEKVDELAVNRNEEPLSKTAKSYLKRYYAYLKYGKWSASLDKGNKYTNKGKLAEPESIALCSFLDDRPYFKNPERFDDEFLTGEPDIIYFAPEGVYIIDVKTSWDIETFVDCLGKDLTPLYWWQIQGYMALIGAKSGEVSYCLVDTPPTILEQEKYNLARRMNPAIDVSVDAAYLEAERELVNNMTFSTDMPHKDRRIKFTVERDDEAIERIYKRIPKCREYLAEIEAMHLKGVFDAKSEKDDSINEDSE